MPRIKTCAKNHPYQTLFFVRTRCVVLFGHHFCCLWMVSTIKTILQHIALTSDQNITITVDKVESYQDPLSKRNKNSYSPESVILIVTGALMNHISQNANTWYRRSDIPDTFKSAWLLAILGIMLTFYVKCCTSQLQEAAET